MVERRKESPGKLTCKVDHQQGKEASSQVKHTGNKRGRPKESEDYPFTYYYRFYTSSKNRRSPIEIERYKPGTPECAAAFADMVRYHKAHYLMGEERRKCSENTSTDKLAKKHEK